MKSYTDLEQSKKLAEILPLESADMKILPFTEREYRIVPINDIAVCGREDEIYAWSLSALLDVLPFPVLYMEMVAGMILWCCKCHFIETDEVVKIEHCGNPVDACVAMIEKLHKLKML